MPGTVFSARAPGPGATGHQGAVSAGQPELSLTPGTQQPLDIVAPEGNLKWKGACNLNVHEFADSQRGYAK
jgi:hypothetical protein